MNSWRNIYGDRQTSTASVTRSRNAVALSFETKIDGNEVLFLFKNSFKENFICMLLKNAFSLCLQLFIHRMQVHMPFSAKKKNLFYRSGVLCEKITRTANYSGNNGRTS